MLVTGSSRGIGADTITYFAEAGARVAVNYRNKEARALKLVNQLRENGAEAIAVGADLTDADSVKGLVDTIASTFGGLDILVLNASGGMESGMAEDYAMQLNRDAQVNFLAAARPLLGEGSPSPPRTRNGQYGSRRGACVGHPAFSDTALAPPCGRSRGGGWGGQVVLR